MAALKVASCPPYESQVDEHIYVKRGMVYGNVDLSLPSPKEFYERYKDDPEDARDSAFKLGRELGDVLRGRLEDPGDDLETVAAILNEFQRTVQGEPTAKVEGDRVVMRCSGFCPVMRAAMTLSLPWRWLDDNLALPLVRGVASTIISGIKLRIPSAKSRGDSTCVYVFET